MTEGEWIACSDTAVLSGELCGISERQLRLFASACLRRVWSLLPNEAARLAVEVNEQYADGRASVRQVLEAWSNAVADTGESSLWIGPGSDLEYGSPPELSGPYCPEHMWGECGPGSDCPICRDIEETAEAEWAAADYIFSGVRDALGLPEWTAAQSVVYARSLVRERVESRHQVVAEEREARAQYALLRDIVGESSGPARVDPFWLRWREGAIVKLAKAIYDGEMFRDLPVLADALEEAGCTTVEILAHCRATAEHVRGCWVLDLLSQKASPGRTIRRT
jgi:hypothetical protein